MPERPSAAWGLKPVEEHHRVALEWVLFQLGLDIGIDVTPLLQATKGADAGLDTKINKFRPSDRHNRDSLTQAVFVVLHEGAYHPGVRDPINLEEDNQQA